jgi:hypothetical protein
MGGEIQIELSPPEAPESDEDHQHWQWDGQKVYGCRQRQLQERQEQQDYASNEYDNTPSENRCTTCDLPIRSPPVEPRPAIKRGQEQWEERR